MYTEKDLVGSVLPLGTGVLGVDDLNTAAVHGEYLILKRCKVRRLMFYVAVSPDGAVTVEFNKRPTAGSASGELLLGQLVIPSGAAVGSVIYKDIDPEVLAVGDGLAMEVVAPGSATIGQGYYGFELEPDPEYVGNEAAMIQSA